MLDCLTWFKQRYCYGGSSQFVWTSVHTLFFSFAFRRHYHYHREHILLQISETAFRFSMGGSRSNDSCFSRDLCLWLTAEFELQLKQRKLGTNFEIFPPEFKPPFSFKVDFSWEIICKQEVFHIILIFVLLFYSDLISAKTMMSPWYWL